MSATPARRAALATLRAVRRGELADRALHTELPRLPARDRPWTHELVYGTLRLRGRLDYVLGQLVHQPLGALVPDVLDTLRLGAYQLLEMASVPAYAAVSQSVELAKAASGQGAGRLVNGVLQSLRRRGEAFSFPRFEQDPLAHLETWGSHPRWLLERWIARFGLAEARALVEADNLRPDLYLRPIGVAAEAARATLEAAGIEAEAVADVPGSLRIESAVSALSAVPSVIQDPAATLVVAAAGATGVAAGRDRAGAHLADVAAAPGGKALALAGGSGETSPGYVVAGDISYDRMLRLRENVSRIESADERRGGSPGGAHKLPLGLIVADARRPPLRDASQDLVLLDAPCTGTGTLRRHPDARWRLEPRDVVVLARLQRELLRAAAGLVRPGGVLVYATCSLEPEENEEQVEGFLADAPDFALEPVSNVHPRFVDDHGRLLVLPQRAGFDGAFAARLRRG